MSRDWKPGDVVAVSGYEDTEETLVGVVRARTGVDALEIAHSEGFDMADDSDLIIRPLVVVDPEDYSTFRPALESWTRLVFGYTANERDCEHFADALRAFANPTPAIEEPTARLAVVLDRGDDEWCHVGEGVWRSLTSTGSYMVEKHWHDACTPLAGNVVRVLSEGIS